MADLVLRPEGMKRISGAFPRQAMRLISSRAAMSGPVAVHGLHDCIRLDRSPAGNGNCAHGKAAAVHGATGTGIFKGLGQLILPDRSRLFLGNESFHRKSE